MSEDRLEKAIEAMKNEPLDPEKIEIVQARVRRKLESRDTPVCEEFARDFQDYVQEKLTGNRKLLLEDHLGRCPNCRAHLADFGCVDLGRKSGHQSQCDNHRRQNGR